MGMKGRMMLGFWSEECDVPIGKISGKGIGMTDDAHGGPPSFCLSLFQYITLVHFLQYKITLYGILLSKNVLYNGINMGMFPLNLEV